MFFKKERKNKKTMLTITFIDNDAIISIENN